MSKIELGPLPEPCAWHVYWEERGNSEMWWDQWHDINDPLPTQWDDEPPTAVTPHFTADQMRAYAEAEVAKERERCARVCEDLAEDVGPATWGSSSRDIALFDCAAAIRKG